MLRVHIQNTPIGRADVRTVRAEELTLWWGDLTAGPAALRNVEQLLSVGFRRAVRQGLRDDNPLERAEVTKPPGRQREVRPLTTAEVEALADAAATPRDRM